ncbi:DUF58 domain-containing protein [Thiocapsa bogorovii]|uniref:DUF58 domain-containing protein n=1 Tax=Thiocapsa bogorovii TaxID=521689 RepID=UPI001E4BAD3C|nr:DUF58 domain-containing protein [Thiocapsa bogorovii]UHD14931.1 DUF58 domain-containing protein [Thiocapsa bogorovii]
MRSNPPTAQDAKTPRARTEGVLPELTELIALREQARRLDLAPRGRVLATRTGGHVARFRGRGMEFDESRVYQPGDDPRNMDWRVTARAGRPHVKLFREERERPVWLLVDQGPSMRFGTRIAFKSVVAARAAALLGWAAVDRGDRVGGLVFDETRHLERRPASRAAGLLPLLDRLASPAPAFSPDAGPSGQSGGYASLGDAAGHLVRLVRPGSLVAVISDFADILRAQTRWMTELAAGCEVILLPVHDSIEIQAPPSGRYPVINGRRRSLLDLTRSGSCKAYEDLFRSRMEAIERLARRNRAHLLRLTADDPVGPALALGLGGRGRLPAAGGIV